jgi:pimeloyl-ACP methyl ester carboxylesterase
VSFTPAHRGGAGEPLVLLHGFMLTWRTWELVLPALERRHDVLAPTLAGHAGGPAIEGPPTSATLADAVERVMDEAGFETAHIVGNSLGGHVALQLAARGRARSVVALAPAGGWAEDDDSYQATLAYFIRVRALVERAAPLAEAIVSSPEGRRGATRFTVTNFEHIPSELIAHQVVGAARCSAFHQLIGLARREGWPLEAGPIDCPLRIVWGTADLVLPWPGAAARFRAAFPQADWVELEGVGHCPQLDVPLETAELILGVSSP